MAAIRLSEMSELELAKRGIVLESFQAAIGRWASYEPFADSTDDFPVFRAWINGNRYRLTSAAMKRNGLIVVKVARRYRKDCYGKRRASGGFILWRFPDWIDLEDVWTFRYEQEAEHKSMAKQLAAVLATG